MNITSIGGRLRDGALASPDRLIVLCLFAITLVRTGAVVISPLGLGVDEAQYWLWSQDPDFGYFTKPPLIAWIIALSHGLFGHHEAAVRLPASWIHLLTALTLWRASAWLYGAHAGRLTALIWISLPAIGLGSFVMSTDTPLLFCVSLALLALAGTATDRLAPHYALMLAGAALGIGMLAKYAALYALFGLMLIWASGRHGDTQLIAGKYLLLALASCLVLASPNLLWNVSHDFTTMRHLGDNANIAKQSHDLIGSLQFIASQAAVAGPLIFGLMLWIIPASRTDKTAAWLAWMGLPALLLISFQAYLSDANANWAMTAYPALSIWLGGWLGDSGAPAYRRWLATLGIGVNLAVCLLLVAITITGSLGTFSPASDPLRRLRGWDKLAQDLIPEISTHKAGRIIVDRRATAALLHWHFYDHDIAILLHDRDGIPSNHFEANHSWAHRPGASVLGLSDTPDAPHIPHIKWQGQPTKSTVRTSHNADRIYFIFRGIE